MSSLIPWWLRHWVVVDSLLSWLLWGSGSLFGQGSDGKMVVVISFTGAHLNFHPSPLPRSPEEVWPRDLTRETKAKVTSDTSSRKSSHVVLHGL